MDKNYFIDKYGTKRLGVEKPCENCNNIFITRADQPQGCCSVKCSFDKKRKDSAIEMICSQCKKVFERPISKKKNSKSGLFFCSRQCKDQAQRLGGISEIMPPHYGTGVESESYRRVYKEAFDIKKLACERCEYDEFECGVDIHHLNEDRSDCRKENLMALCSPCHRGLHFKLWELSDMKKKEVVTGEFQKSDGCTRDPTPYPGWVLDKYLNTLAVNIHQQ